MGNVGQTIPSDERSHGSSGQQGRARHLLLVALAALLAGFVSLLVPVAPAEAAVVIVDSPADAAPPADDGLCTLREAIENANNDALTHDDCLVAGEADPAVDEITFAIPGALPVIAGFPSPHRIELATALPDIVGRLTVDGWSQGPANYAGPPLIWVDGANLVATTTVLTDQFELRGVAVTKFGTGLMIAGGGTHRIVGSYFGGRPVFAVGGPPFVTTGTSVDDATFCVCGPTANGNGGGIDVAALNPAVATVTIGGTDTGEGNVFVTNGVAVVVTNATEDHSVTLLGNFVGTDRAGAPNLGNDLGGFLAFSLNVATIGDGTVAGRNVFVDNGGPAIQVVGSTDSTVKGNYIGITPGGTVLGNFLGIDVTVPVDMDIGGPTAGEGNVIVGSTDGPGIQILGGDGITIRGNFIGVGPDGSTPFANQAGIDILGAFETDIGGLAPGERNVISGNTNGPGILLEFADSTRIRGNYIGVAANGSTPLANDVGVANVESSFTWLGGDTPEARNVISGNTTDGVYFEGDCGCFGVPTLVHGNYIGLNANGDADVGNGDNGIRTVDAFDIVIGGFGIGEGNVISGNDDHGITLVGLSEDIEVYGNRIGTNAAGTLAIGNGLDGVNAIPDDSVDPELGPEDITIGHDTPGAGNLISGNGRHGVYLSWTFDEQLVIHNLIGVNVNGDPLGNGRVGVLTDNAPEAIVFENFIANNGRAGVLVVPLSTCLCFDLGTLILTNSVYNNNGPGIDVSKTLNLANGTGDGITPNDSPDVDGIQNFPVVETATTSVVGTVITGRLESVPEAVYRVELFATPSCDVPSFGEGRAFLAGIDVTTDVAGNGTFKMTVPTVPEGHVVTSTASNPDQSTSEFSACAPVTTAAVLVSPTSGLTTTEAGGQATFTVALSTLPTAPVTIALTSSDTTEGNVSPSPLTLTFTPLNGTTPQQVTITGQQDVPAVADGNQTYTIVTAAAVSADLAYNTLNGPDVSVVNLDATVPALSITPASVAEGTGGAAPMTFTVTLSQASSAPVSANWQVVNGTANLSHDIVPADATGVVTFTPGETTKPIVIRVVSDSLPEPTETFTLKLTTSTGASIAVQEALGTITDDDLPAGPCSPRPQVSMTTVRTGTNQLVVTVKAGLGTLKKITFASAARPMDNAQVETIGPASVIQGFGVFTPPPNVTQQSFVVRRIVPNLPVMVEFVVEDDCGNWPTLIGNGPNPW